MPIEWAGELVIVLASGKADALSGRWIGVRDYVAEMLRQIEEIKKDALYVWSFRGLNNAKKPAPSG